MTLIRCPHAPRCRTWINYPTPAEADRALAAHLQDRHQTKETTMSDTERSDSAQAEDDARRVVDDYAALDRAIGAVLFNASNFPDKVQTRILGQNMRPLTEKLVDAVLAAGFHRQGIERTLDSPQLTAALAQAQDIITADDERLARVRAATGPAYAAVPHFQPLRDLVAALGATR